MNKFHYHLIIFLCFILICLTSNAQKDTLVMLNGSVIFTTVIETNDSVTRIRNPKKQNAVLLIENNRIFSVVSKEGEKVYYKYDSLNGNDLTIDEMRIYIIGEQDAQRGYKPRFTSICGFVLGAGAGITGSFLSPTIPFAYSSLLNIPKIKINKKSVSDPELLKKDVYLMGYQKVAGKKRYLHSLLSGGAGLVSGLITFGILKKNDIDLF